MTIQEFIPNRFERLDDEDLQFDLYVFADIIADDSYHYARILRKYHELIVTLLEKQTKEFQEK